MRSGVTRADVSAAVGHKVFSYLEVTDDSDTFVNLGALAVGSATLDFFNTATLSESIDSNTLSFSAEVKNTIGLYGLSPLRTDSLVNESAVTPGTYAPRLDLHRRWRIMVAVVAPGVTPVVPTDYRELNTGYVTDLKIGADVITIEGQGMEAPILSAFVIEDRVYASDDMEDVIQLALDDQFGTGVIPLSTPVSPSFLVADTIGDINLMPALSDIAALTAWSLRYRYDSSDVNALTLFNPPRGNTTPDWSIADTEYERLDVELDEGPVRNFIVVRYQDTTSGLQTVVSPGAEAGTLSCTGGVGTFSTSQAGVLADGARVVVDRTGLGDFVAYTVTAFDGTTGCTLTGAPDFTARQFYTSASITKYDLRVMVMDLSTKTQIVDATAAGNLADAVRADREDPSLVQSLMAPGLWFTQLHDFVGTGANGVLYNDDQSGGVTSYTQHFADGMLETTVNLAGSIKGRFTTWKRIGSGASAVPTVPSLTWLYSVESDGAGGQQANISVTVLNEGPEFVNLTARTQLGNLYYHTDVTGATRQFVASGTVVDQTDTFSDGITVTTFLGPIAIIPGGVPWIDLQVESQSGKLSLVQRVPILVAAAPTDTATVQWDLSVPGELKADVIAGGGSGVAPDDVDYLVKTASGDLSAERVVTDTTTVTWDWATSGQAKAQIPSSVALPGSPTTTTQSAGDNSTKVATTAYVDTGLALKAPLASPALTGVPTAPTASVGTNTTQLATTAFVLANGGSGGAPTTADYLVKTADAGLSAERVVTDTTTIETDWSTAGQAKIKIVSSAPLPGSPTTTTQSPGDNSTKIATTAYADAAVAAAKLLTKNTQTNSYTLVLSDAGKCIEMDKATAVTLTVPPNSSVAMPVDVVIEVYAKGAGVVTLTPGAGVTFRNPAGATLRAQYSTASMRQRATDEWVISGDLS